MECQCINTPIDTTGTAQCGDDHGGDNTTHHVDTDDDTFYFSDTAGYGINIWHSSGY